MPYLFAHYLADLQLKYGLCGGGRPGATMGAEGLGGRVGGGGATRQINSRRARATGRSAPPDCFKLQLFVPANNELTQCFRFPSTGYFFYGHYRRL